MVGILRYFRQELHIEWATKRSKAHGNKVHVPEKLTWRVSEPANYDRRNILMHRTVAHRIQNSSFYPLTISKLLRGVFVKFVRYHQRRIPWLKAASKRPLSHILSIIHAGQVRGQESSFYIFFSAARGNGVPDVWQNLDICRLVLVIKYYRVGTDCNTDLYSSMILGLF